MACRTLEVIIIAQPILSKRDYILHKKKAQSMMLDNFYQGGGRSIGLQRPKCTHKYQLLL